MEGMMFVYYDTDGNIKSISPVADVDNNADHLVTQQSEEAVYPFLTAQASVSDYLITDKFVNGSKTQAIVRKVVNISYARTLDNYLMEIRSPYSIENIINIENDTTKKVFKITISDEFKTLYTEGTEEQVDAAQTFINTRSAPVYITKRHDPYSLIHTINLSPADLFYRGILYINYEADCRNTSAYTKRIVSGYGYTEKA